MRRIRACFGKTTKGLLTKVAAGVDSNAWYNMKVQDYMDTAPALLEKGHLVAKFGAELGSLEPTEGGFQELQAMVKEVAVLQQCLRQGSTEKLQEDIRIKVTSLWEEAEKNSKADTPVLQAASQALVDCSLLFPLDDQIQVFTHACGDLLRKCDLKQDVEMFNRACSAFLEQQAQPPSDSEANAEAMATLTTGTGSLRGSLGSLPDESKGLAHGAQMKIIALLGGCLGDDTLSMEPYLPCADVLGSILEDPGLAKLVSFLSSVGEVKQCRAKLEAGGDTMDCTLDGDKDMQKTIGLQRAILKAKASRKAADQLNMISDQAWLGHAQEILTTSEASLDKVNAARAKQSLDTLESAHKRLQDISGGLEGGKSWLDGCKATSFEELQVHAGNTIMQTNGKQLVHLAEEVKEAMQ